MGMQIIKSDGEDLQIKIGFSPWKQLDKTTNLGDIGYHGVKIEIRKVCGHPANKVSWDGADYCEQCEEFI